MAGKLTRLIKDAEARVKELDDALCHRELQLGVQNTRISQLEEQLKDAEARVKDAEEVIREMWLIAVTIQNGFPEDAKYIVKKYNDYRTKYGEVE